MSEWRGWLARVGLVILALAFPGSAHVRLQRYQRAVFLFASYALLLVGLTAYIALVRDWTFGKWLILPVAVMLLLAVFLASPLLAWRDSRSRERPVAPWSRWYAVLAIPVASVALSALTPDPALWIRSFWIPAESMLPTLHVGDRIVVEPDDRNPWRVGHIIVFDRGGEARVDRVVALGGQRVEIRRGLVLIDGVVARIAATADAIIKRETLVGEVGSHLIRDDGISTGDEFGPILVPRGHVFVLGDNRDNSADSRFPRAEYGVGMVPVESIIGRAKFVYWSRNWSRIATPL